MLLRQVCETVREADRPAVPGPALSGRSRAYAFQHDPTAFASEHERSTRREIARRLARLKAIEFGGECDVHTLPEGGGYLVPGDTLVGEPEARRLGIVCHDDLFGGVVPYAFVSTKAITHPLIGPGAVAPLGWCERFAPLVDGAVLDGWTAFSVADALLAGLRLLEAGAVRIKCVRATAGRDQWVVTDANELCQRLAALDGTAVAEHGVVLEQNLSEVETFSVGQVWVGGLVCSYHGVQRLTRDNQGASVYGGSTIHAVRGDFDVLLTACATPAVRLAVQQASRYHAAALACFPGMVLSRINYDVARGRDASGRWRSGVLEQSWRVGGASGAEIAALEQFMARPGCDAVTCASHEVYGEPAPPPATATVYFQGHDPTVGMLTKYALVETNVHP